MFDNMDLSKMSEIISSVKETVEAYESEVANKI